MYRKAFKAIAALSIAFAAVLVGCAPKADPYKEELQKIIVNLVQIVKVYLNHYLK